MLLRHPWASQVIESRTNPSPVVLDYIESIIGMFRAGGLSPALTHQVMHALGSRVWGFTQELFPSPPPADPQAQAALAQAIAARHPGIVQIAMAGTHDRGTIVGPGCDDQYEFEFALDLLLDGFERLHQQGWPSGQSVGEGRPRRIWAMRRSRVLTCRECAPNSAASNGRSVSRYSRPSLARPIAGSIMPSW